MSDSQTSPGQRPDYSEAQIRAAEGSVRALVADLRYIMGSESSDRWPEFATAALRHHSPSVPDDQLTPQLSQLQTAARKALQGLTTNSFETIRDAVTEVRGIESQLK